MVSQQNPSGSVAMETMGFTTGFPASPALASVMSNLTHGPARSESALCSSYMVPAPQTPIVAASPAEGTLRSPKPLKQVLMDAGNKALGGGIPGMAAMATQVRFESSVLHSDASCLQRQPNTVLEDISKSSMDCVVIDCSGHAKCVLAF
jgi:hypothetical protein